MTLSLFFQMYWLTIILILHFAVALFCFGKAIKNKRREGVVVGFLLWVFLAAALLIFSGCQFIGEQILSKKAVYEFDGKKILIIGNLFSEDEKKYGVDESYNQIKSAFKTMPPEMAEQIPIIIIKPNWHFPIKSIGGYSHYVGNRRERWRGVVCLMQPIFSDGGLLVWGSNTTLWQLAAEARVEELGKLFADEWRQAADYEYGGRKDVWYSRDNEALFWKMNKTSSLYDPQFGFTSARGTKSVAADVAEFVVVVVELPTLYELPEQFSAAAAADGRYRKKIDLLFKHKFITESQYQKTKQLLAIN